MPPPEKASPTQSSSSPRGAARVVAFSPSATLFSGGLMTAQPASAASANSSGMALAGWRTRAPSGFVNYPASLGHEISILKPLSVAGRASLAP